MDVLRKKLDRDRPSSQLSKKADNLSNYGAEQLSDNKSIGRARRDLIRKEHQLADV